MSFRLLVSGKHACFPRPEFRDAAVSYDVLTPIAAIGLIEGIHWKPAIRWRVDAIHLLKPVQLEMLSRGGDASPVWALVNPEWAIDFHFELTDRAGDRDSHDAHASMFLRKARQQKGTGFLGLSDMPATVTLAATTDVTIAAVDQPIIDFGWLPFQRVPHEPRRFRYFRAYAVSGTIMVPNGATDEVFA